MTVETKEKYCPICGKPVTDSAYNRFGEWCCSEAHAEEYVKEVRARKVQAVAFQARSGSRDVSQEGWSARQRGGCC